jgi:polyisoprenoid-binding protein YceI
VALAAGTYALGPSDGTVQVKTYRDGIAQAVGHDLVFEVTQWNATVTVGGDGAPAIELTVDPTSLEVREGLRGVKPLTDKDRADIKKNIDAKVLERRPISFRSKSATVGDRISVTGDLTLGGTTREATFELADSDGRLTGTLPITQSDYGIKPFRALMGALRVRDSVDVEIDVKVA